MNLVSVQGPVQFSSIKNVEKTNLRWSLKTKIYRMKIDNKLHAFIIHN